MIDGRRNRTKKVSSPTATPAPRRSIGSWLVAAGVGANTITAVGVAIAALTGLLVAFGYFIAGVALITVGGLMDTLDGHVAKAAGTSSSRGAFLDSVADRVADSFVFIGLSGYFIRTHEATAALLPIAILAISNVVSYERAKAESLGFTAARGGVMERAERLIFLAIALLVGTFAHVALVPMLIALAALTTMTAAGRFVRVWREASGKHPLVGFGGRTLAGTRRRAWAASRRAERSRRPRRELAPLTTRLRGVFGTGTARTETRRERTTLRRSAHAIVRRIDIDR